MGRSCATDLTPFRGTNDHPDYQTMTVAKEFRPQPRKRGVHYLTASISTATHGELKRIAEYDGVSVAWITRKLCDEYVARWKTHHPELPL